MVRTKASILCLFIDKKIGVVAYKPRVNSCHTFHYGVLAQANIVCQYFTGTNRAFKAICHSFWFTDNLDKLHIFGSYYLASQSTKVRILPKNCFFVVIFWSKLMEFYQVVSKILLTDVHQTSSLYIQYILNVIALKDAFIS